MDKRIVVNQKSNSHISRITACVKIVMTDDKTYFIADSINEFLNRVKEAKDIPLVRTIDVFNEAICINPNYIKTIVEGRCVTVQEEFISSGEKRVVSKYYVMSSSEDPILSERSENNYLPTATQIYKTANELSW